MKTLDECFDDIRECFDVSEKVSKATIDKWVAAQGKVNELAAKLAASESRVVELESEVTTLQAQVKHSWAC